MSDCSTLRPLHRVVALAVVLLGVGMLDSCVPWTVRPIEDEKQGPDAGNQTAGSPATYVDSIWTSKLIPELLKSALDARTLADALAVSVGQAGQKYGHREGSGTYNFVVKGTGRVLSVDTSSRHGIIQVDIAPFDKRSDLSIQIGPVVRGFSLRDATGIIQFTSFANQLQFADVGNELNQRVLKSVLSAIDPKTLNGRTVSFVGTFSQDQSEQPSMRDIVPVQLTVESLR